MTPGFVRVSRMAGKKILAQKFDKMNRGTLKIKAGHTRTGACAKPSSQGCTCARRK